MDISDLRGIVPPVVTPLDKNKNFDKQSYKNVIERLIDAGVDALFVMGSSGAAVFLTCKQREEVAAATAEIVKGRIPVLMGCIDTQTPRVLELVEIAEKYKADGIVVTAPFYAIDSDIIVENHFRLIRKATKLPIFAYDLPQCVHKKLDINMLIRLAKEGVIQGVKDSSGEDIEFRKLTILNEEAGTPLRIFTGHEVVVDGALLSGAHGVVPGLANVDPKVYVDMRDAARARDWEKVKKLQDRAAKLMHIAYCTSKPMGFSTGVGGFMTALREMGIIATNNMPDPALALEGEDVERIREYLKEADLL